MNNKNVEEIFRRTRIAKDEAAIVVNLEGSNTKINTITHSIQALINEFNSAYGTELVLKVNSEKNLHQKLLIKALLI